MKFSKHRADDGTSTITVDDAGDEEVLMICLDLFDSVDPDFMGIDAGHVYIHAANGSLRYVITEINAAQGILRARKVPAMSVIREQIEHEERETP